MNWCRQHNSSLEYVKHSGIIESPGYPLWSLPSLDCSITLIAEPGSKILLTLMDFDVGEAKKTLKTDKCENVFHSNSDYVKIDVDDSKSITVCGSISSNGPLIGEQYLSFSNKLTLSYKTHERIFRTTFIKRRGFKFKYSIVSNKSTVVTVLRPKEDAIGTINNLNFPYSTPPGIENTIYIRTAIGSNIEIRPAKWTQLIIKEDDCSENERDVAIKIIDAFGDTSVLPATTHSWTVCRISSDLDSHLMSGTESKAHGHLHRFKPVKSAFHVMTVSVLAIHTHLTPFQFMFKIKKAIFNSIET
ncbi:cubilin-like protein [Leptotrombidium deliense]|uniref:Cubilin-like protein n=1 Tax=Leptotrombidium deliense TaxID=299467 RepID=A0A443SJ50_9ACAR|nr:cubilin-like protein [Leptotrombidium deliense]